ncbi:MAG: hypothetical protein M1821_003803 [Bathelium mastoideum]|nr:MAG: hypothetical protein M1821_003803 [Bathelium mastoideum]
MPEWIRTLTKRGKPSTERKERRELLTEFAKTFYDKHLSRLPVHVNPGLTNSLQKLNQRVLMLAKSQGDRFREDVVDVQAHINEMDVNHIQNGLGIQDDLVGSRIREELESIRNDWNTARKKWEATRS